MLSKNQIKYYKSLQIKKFRQIHQSFTVEGAKSVVELLESDFEVELVAATEDFLDSHATLLRATGVDTVPATEGDLAQIGSFQSNNACVAIAKTKENRFTDVSGQEIVIVLDDIRDPGNLGTIIRIADWYGFPKIVCSVTTTDFYNPKVIAASMGSFTRVQMYYAELPAYLETAAPAPVFGTFLEGASVYDAVFGPKGGYLVLGNEANGISGEVAAYVTEKISIPRFGGAESLNAGIATAVVCDNIRRQWK
ncbi:RNA methyltransferase [Ravibacter arvi]|uniref:RNA methyltransferase n=1 Tax=Ravibacter arvi TaxID=2051041 RepID=A0ABP8M3I4_9BACT